MTSCASQKFVQTILFALMFRFMFTVVNEICPNRSSVKVKLFSILFSNLLHCILEIRL